MWPFMATLQATDKLSFNARAEYLDDSAGLIYGGYGPHGGRNHIHHPVSTVGERVEPRGIPLGSRRTWQLFDASHHRLPGAASKANAFMLAFNLIYQF
jgi:hypothetical protein